MRPLRQQAGGGVIRALHGAIREIIYHGSAAELEYLRRLSRSYMLLFFVQCDPHVCSYFDVLASKLHVFVCNSMIVPALSEICLPRENRRHWNLLQQARDAGVHLSINRVTLDELVGHIRLAIEAYDNEYRPVQDHYSDERTLIYVNHIIVRAYLYQRAHGESYSFDNFINRFVSPRKGAAAMRQELIIFLREEFGIEFLDDAALGVRIDGTAHKTLTDELRQLKRTQRQAENDGTTILTIYALREKNNESGSGGVFGFRTWWLSKDTTTHRAVKRAFKNKPLISCYLRPDFLLNYVALSTRSRAAGKVFDQMFPTLMGVGLSHHVSEELNETVHKSIQRHRELSSSRVKAVIGGMSTRLMTEANAGRGKQLRHILEEAFDKAKAKRRKKKPRHHL
jgi:hypothetical protein